MCSRDVWDEIVTWPQIWLFLLQHLSINQNWSGIFHMKFQTQFFLYFAFFYFWKYVNFPWWMWKQQLWNSQKIHLLGRKWNLNKSLPGIAGGETCYLTLSSLLSQLCHLVQRSGILHILGTVQSLLLWLLELSRGNQAAEKWSSYPSGWDAKEPGGACFCKLGSDREASPELSG